MNDMAGEQVSSEITRAAIPRVVEPADQTGSAGELVLDRGTFQTLATVDGRRTVAQIIAQRNRPETLGELARLIDLGLVRLDPPAANSAQASSDAALSGPSKRVIRRASSASAAGSAEPGRATEARPPTRPSGCPKLGLVVNLTTFHPLSIRNALHLPSQHYRCLARPNAESIPTQDQTAFCLTERYSSCPRFIEALPPSAEQPPTIKLARARTSLPGLGRLTVRHGIWLVVPSAVLLVLSFNVVVPAIMLAPETPLALATQEADLPRSATAPVSIATLPPTPLPLVAAPIEPLPTLDEAPPAEVETAEPERPLPGHRTPLRTVLDVSFADQPSGWPNDLQGTARFVDGAYHLFARQPSQFVAIGAPLDTPAGESLRDVVVTATFRKVGGPAGGGYGLIVRDQGPGPRDGVNQVGNYYVLEVGDRGELGIWLRDGRRWLDLIPWSPSNVVRPGGETNELIAMAIGPQLTFLVNGVPVASLLDETLHEGSVGIFVGGDLNQVELDTFAVYVPA